MYKTDVKLGFYAKYIKRVLDFVLSLLALVILSPLFIVVAVLVRIKLGKPVFFNQRRAGKDEKPFVMHKFRTMSDKRDANGELLPDEVRLTSFGNFLRKTSVDELPELINILKGEMSIIGPRPLYMEYLPYYTYEESVRHVVRGGLTGLAQVNGRAVSPLEERLQYDIEYVTNITFINDVKILIKTVLKVSKSEDIGDPASDYDMRLDVSRDVQRQGYL